MTKRNILGFFAAMLLAGFITFSDAVADEHKSETVKIKTSAVCGMCEKTIEDGLKDHEGVIKSDLDVDSKYVTVTYKPDDTSPKEIRKDIAKMGYDADDTKADKQARKNLPNCCKPKHCK
jgi:copper chaperone CopZ